MKGQKAVCAPLKQQVILPALLAVLMLAAAVCVLHGVNAVSLRGAAAFGDYVQLEPTGEALTLSSQKVKAERAYAVYEDADKQFALHMEQVQTQGDVLHIRGSLLRVNQPVGEVRVRVGLAEQGAQEAVLLNTQMVRQANYAAENGYDDHCGFSAAVKKTAIAPGAYDVVLTDETDGAKRMLRTGYVLQMPGEGAAFLTEAPEESEGTHAQ